MKTKKYVVATENGTGIIVFESDSKRMCNAYLKQAQQKGSERGFLKCIAGAEWLRSREEMLQ